MLSLAARRLPKCNSGSALAYAASVKHVVLISRKPLQVEGATIVAASVLPEIYADGRLAQDVSLAFVGGEYLKESLQKEPFG